MSTYKRIGIISLSLLVFFSITFFIFEVYSSRNGKLFISFLNIGQGDAIYIEAPNGKQILIDGGGDGIVLRELSKVMPLFDRTLDMIMITNPDKDHIGGFINVLQRYKVEHLIEPGTINDSDTYKTVKDLANGNGVETVLARRGMNIVLDFERNIYIHILFPDRDVSKLETNDGSIIAKLVYGNTSVLLEGDAPQNTERYVMYLNKEEIDSDILKIGHHGSRTSTDKNYVIAASPEYAVISLGKDNKYGHPHKETIDTLNNLSVPILRTDLLGRISFESDGERFIRVN